MVLGDCLISASRCDDAVAMIRPVYEARLRHAEQEPKEYVVAGIRLAVALGQLQQIDEARSVSTLAEAVAQRRLSPDDELVRDAELTRQHFEGRA